MAIEHELIVADYNAVEARGTAWLAGAKALLGVFQRGEDPYLYQACNIYKVPLGTFTKKNTAQRQLGKKTILACGYQMGWENFQAQCLLENPPIILTKDEAEAVVKSYRQDNSEIPLLWKELERGALDAVLHPEKPVDSAGSKIRFYRKGTWLWMRLPSGRLLWYPTRTSPCARCPGSPTMGRRRGNAVSVLWASTARRTAGRSIGATAGCGPRTRCRRFAAIC
jgi:DNA polymerase bacteriophage-type